MQVSADCVSRNQPDAVLLYNRTTDEMHLVSKWGYYVFQNFDGVRTVGDIAESFCGTTGSPDAQEEYLLRFVRDLVDRGLLEESNNA